MLGLLLGNRDLIDTSTWDVLIKTGTAHLLAISGLHLGLVFAWVWLLLKLVGRGFSAIFAKNLDAIILITALTFTWLFAALTGLATPSLRAALFISVFVIAHLIKLNLTWRFKYLLAMALVLLLKCGKSIERKNKSSISSSAISLALGSLYMSRTLGAKSFI